MFSALKDTAVNQNSGVMPKRQNNSVLDLPDLQDSL